MTSEATIGNETNGLQVVRGGDVLRISLNRPETRNAFDADLIGAIEAAFADVDHVRVVVISGEGASFSAGADLAWMRRAAGLSFAENLADADGLRRMLETVYSCPAPVVARVQGHAFGGACGLIACADIALATEDAVFAFSEVKLGLVPATISPFVIERIGASAAGRYFVTGERFDAPAALHIGLIHGIESDIDVAVDRTVAEILSAGPSAVRSAKRLVRERPIGEETSRWIAERRVSDEGQEGLKAFFEKRSPPW
jgi:methylglutaconyl-CoA hydratase